MKKATRNGLSILTIGLLTVATLAGCNQQAEKETTQRESRSMEMAVVDKEQPTRQAEESLDISSAEELVDKVEDKSDPKVDTENEEEENKMPPYFCGTPDMMTRDEKNTELQEKDTDLDQSTEIIGKIISIDNKDVNLLVGDIGHIYKNVDNTEKFTEGQTVRIFVIPGGYSMEKYHQVPSDIKHNTMGDRLYGGSGTVKEISQDGIVIATPQGLLTLKGQGQGINEEDEVNFEYTLSGEEKILWFIKKQMKPNMKLKETEREPITLPIEKINE